MLGSLRRLVKSMLLKYWLILAVYIPSAVAMDYFHLSQVRLLESDFSRAQSRNIEYLLALDPERLLAPYYTAAGLEPKAVNYGNWESAGLDGHMAGHYLSALSMAWAATANVEVKRRLDDMLLQLSEIQKANRNGYLGAVPNGKLLWQQLSSGKVEADLFTLNRTWVPWYNIHKMLAGLRDAWWYASDNTAKQMLIDFALWIEAVTANLSDGDMQAMLITEYGGMNELLADVADITGDQRFIQLAKRFNQQSFLQPLIEQKDKLSGLHANTQIPKVVGFERLAALTESKTLHSASEYFWKNVVDSRSVAIGGNSVREHFHATDDFQSMLDEVEGPETCNTYNLLKLTRLLYQRAPKQQYVDYYERALYNHILSSQDPKTGGLVYFTPMRPQHYRVYSSVEDGMWCCVGSGLENHTKYGEFIYAYQANELYVNLFIPSRLRWDSLGTTIRQETGFPDQDSTRIIFESDSSVSLRLRYPSWVTGDGPHLTINGKPVKVEISPQGYIELERPWSKGDQVELHLPMSISSETLPGVPDYHALFYGPIVLAAKTQPFAGEQLDFIADDSRMGHIASGEVCPVDRVPIFVSDKLDFTKNISRVAGNPLQFSVTEGAGLMGLAKPVLMPFYRLHRSRYMLYWPHATPAQLVKKQQQRKLLEGKHKRLSSLTLDQVSPGEQQPEVEHDYTGQEAEAGVNFGRHWRHASGWFEYTLADEKLQATVLRIDYWGADKGRRFSIEVNGVTVAVVESSGEHGATFISQDYPLSDKIVSMAVEGRHRVRFVAAENSIAGGIYGVRLLKAAP